MDPTAAPEPPGPIVDVPPSPEPTWELDGTEPEQVLEWDPGAEALTARAATAPPPELARLLRYLQVPFDTFAPAESRYFGALSLALSRAGAIGAGEVVDRTTFEAAVRAFQKMKGLSEDGLPGQDCCWALQSSWAVEHKLSIARVEADRVSGSGGGDSFWFRSDVVPAYEAVRAEVRAAGGVVTSVGAFRALGAEVTPGRSRTSMHYTGLALDLATDMAMSDPQRDRYLVAFDGRKWRLWCRSDAAPAHEIDAIIWKNQKLQSHSLTANAFDLTAIFERHGFARIGPRSSFPSDYMGAEWWHFQYEAALAPWLSQFGAELLRLAPIRSAGKTYAYDEPQLAAYDLWESKKRIFQRVKDGWW